MGKRNRQSDEAWAHAKKVCRLNARQVDMAKKLGMNPRNLPRLNPSPSQRWKLPVGEFIEECYAKRFEDELDLDSSPLPRREDRWTSAPPPEDEESARRYALATDLVAHFANLQLDLEEKLVAGCVEPETLTRIAKDLRRVADEIDTGKDVSQMPYNDDLGGLADDDIPF